MAARHGWIQCGTGGRSHTRGAVRVSAAPKSVHTGTKQEVAGKEGVTSGRAGGRHCGGRVGPPSAAPVAAAPIAAAAAAAAGVTAKAACCCCWRGCSKYKLLRCRHELRGRPQKLRAARPSSEAALAAGEADGAEDDDGDEDEDEHHDQLHLHVLPPHAAAQLPPRLVELVRLWGQGGIGARRQVWAKRLEASTRWRNTGALSTTGCLLTCCVWRCMHQHRTAPRPSHPRTWNRRLSVLSTSSSIFSPRSSTFSMLSTCAADGVQTATYGGSSSSSSGEARSIVCNVQSHSQPPPARAAAAGGALAQLHLRSAPCP